MNAYLTTNEDVERRALNQPAGHWFTIQDINDGRYSSREWLHYDDMAHRRFRRVQDGQDGATLIQSQQDRHRFAWLHLIWSRQEKPEAS